jgi:hypothetical protein
MVATIVFSQNNITNVGKGNNQLAYQFPNSVSFPHHEVAVQNISMYYSWVNINASTLNNNTFYYRWPQGGVATTYSVVIPDGLYEISTINSYLQFLMIQRGQYVYDSTSATNVYFAEMVVNPSSYSVQINTYNIPVQFNVTGTGQTITISGVNYVVPVGWIATGGAYLPTVTMCNPTTLQYTNFYKVVGFPPLWSSYNTGTVANPVYNYGILAGAAGLTKSAISTTAPQVQPNPTLFFAISNIDNKYSNPSTIVYQLNADVAFGDLISITPPQFAFNKLLPGTYNGLRLAILGTNLQPIDILDPAMTITLVIRDKKDLSIADALGSANGGK